MVLVKDPKRVSVSKMSKKARREHYAASRGSWQGVVPVTRVIPDKRAQSIARQRIDPEQYSADPPHAWNKMHKLLYFNMK